MHQHYKIISSTILYLKNKKITLACLEEGGDGQGGNRAVRVGNQVLEVEIARRDRGRMGHRHLVQGADSREPEIKEI